MKAIDRKTAVGEIVALEPGRSRVFERLGIDYCCGGKKPLEAACREKGLEPDSVLRELLAEKPAGEGGTDWTRAALARLVEHILSTHHLYLRREMPRLSVLSGKVREAHGERHPELSELARVFQDLRAELESHMFKEEQVLFPMVVALESSVTRPRFHCGSVENPMGVMVEEHEAAGRALSRMRELTHGYRTPEDGCNTYRALMDGLLELEGDLHRHISLENNILFPRAAAVEAALPPA